jgi:hypothetical protein
MKKLHTMGTQEFTYTPRSTTSDSLTLSRVHVVAVSDFWHTSGTQPRATHDFPHMTSGLLVIHPQSSVRDARSQSSLR